MARPIVELFFQYGKFDASSTAITATALMFFSIGMIGYSYAEVLNKSFFAMQDAKTPMVTALVSIAVSVVLSYFLSKGFGVGGLALASALASTVNAVLNFVLINKRVQGIFDKDDFLDILKIICSALIMSAAVFGIYRFITPYFGDNFFGRLLTLGVPSLVGAILYLVFCFIFRVTEMNLMVDTFLRKKR